MTMLLSLALLNFVWMLVNAYCYEHIKKMECYSGYVVPGESPDHALKCAIPVEDESAFPHVWIVEAKWSNGNSKTFGNFDESYSARDLAKSMIANNVGDYVEISEINTAGVVVDTITLRGTY